MNSTAVVLGTFAFGYVLAIVFRAINAIIAPDLVADVGLDAAALGVLTAALLFAHAACQLPLGLALDRFGPRRVQAALFCCAATGAFIFAFGDDVVTLAIARAMIGFGFAGSLMSGFKAVVLCMPERQAFGNAIVMAGGQCGLILATWPAELAVEQIGWRNLFIVLAAVTIGVALLFLRAVPEWPAKASGGGLREQLAGLGRVYTNRTFWRIAPLAMASGGTSIGIATLWSGPWFHDVAGYDRDGVATGLLIVAVSTVTGIFAGGWTADRLARHGVGLLTVMTGFQVVLLTSEFVIMLGATPVMIPAWICFALAGQSAILCYPWLAAFFGAGVSSRAQTAVNVMMFVYAFIVQAGVGAIIDLFPQTELGGYDPLGFTVSIAVFLTIQVCAFAWFASGLRALPAFPSAPQ